MENFTSSATTVDVYNDDLNQQLIMENNILIVGLITMTSLIIGTVFISSIRKE